MLSEYEAAVLTRLRANGGDRRLDRIAPRNNRIGAALVVLSLLSAAGLLHTTVSGRSEYLRAKQGVVDVPVGPAAAAGSNDPSAKGESIVLWFGYLEFEGDRP